MRKSLHIIVYVSAINLSFTINDKLIGRPIINRIPEVRISILQSVNKMKISIFRIAGIANL